MSCGNSFSKWWLITVFATVILSNQVMRVMAQEIEVVAAMNYSCKTVSRGGMSWEVFLANDSSLYKVNIWNRRNPVLEDSCIIPGQIHAMRADFFNVYLVGDSGMFIASTARCDSITSDKRYPAINGITVIRGYAYMIGDSGMRIMQLTPGARSLPIILDHQYIPGINYGIAINSEYVYIAGDSGLYQVELVHNLWAIVRNHLGIPGGGKSVAVDEHYAYVTGSWGLYVVDLEEFERVGERCYIPGGGNSVVVNRGHAFVAGDDGLSIINLTNPANPHRIGFLRTAMATDVAIDERYVYLADISGFWILDPSAVLEAPEFTPVTSPTGFYLSAYPNPFNGIAQIWFELPAGQIVNLALYSASGQKIADLANGWYSAGSHSREFNGGNLPSGTYVIRLFGRTSYPATTRLLLIK